MNTSIFRLFCVKSALLLTGCCILCSPSIAATRLYTYDNLNRLVQIEYENGTSTEYTYDAAGNRLTRSENAVSISGRVADTTGNPIANVCVNVSTSRCATSIGTYTTDADGIYSTNLPAGEYYLNTDVSCDGNNPPSYYLDTNWTSTGGITDCTAAESVTVIAGQSTDDIDFTLVKGGAASGILYQSNGTTPITGETDLGVEIYSGDPCNNPILTGYAPIDATNGQYQSSSLPVGTYYLKTNTNATTYTMEWWAEPESQIDCSFAQHVNVAVGQTTLSRDFQLVLEVDSDSDGLFDSLENATCTDAHDADTDDDGIADGVEDVNHNGQVDTGETDPCNVDSDGDDIQDGTELGYTLASIGPDTNTAIFIADQDPNSVSDPLNNDTDGDGIVDGQEDLNHNGKVDNGETDPLDSNNKAQSSFFIIRAENGKTIIINL